jgi:ParB family transcriptional regulator, chromosome partitioning protein
MDFKLDSLRLDEIDLTNVFYRITTPQDKLPLTPSVERLGLLCPVVVKASDDQFVIVSGFRRIDACRQSRWTDIPCRILPDDISPLTCAEMAIADNLTQRSLNFVEQARCLELLTAATGGLNAARTVAETLGLAFSNALVAKLKSILHAPEFVREGLIKGTLSLPVVLAMSDFARQDAFALTHLFERVPMGLNKQREILQNVKEIAIREDIEVRHVLADDRLQAILKDDALDGNEQARRIRFYLKRRRFPRIVEVEEAFNDRVRQLGLGGDVHVAPPPGFEGTTLTITIRSRDLTSLKRAHHKLSQALENPYVTHLFD